jgi:glycosyltransferase involved in cell wall biosynthesis
MSIIRINPQLVVVIPTKNRRILLERAIASVLSQSYNSYRVIIINDGSTDDTREYLDSLHDSRITVIHNEQSRGVNAARNAAFKILQEGEWAIPLDDDDLFLPNAFEIIAQTIKNIPPSTQMVCFNTIIRTLEEEFIGGHQFVEGELWYEPSYHSIMTGEGLRMRGDALGAWKWTLFPKYLFQEDINGFEGEWGQLLARDGITARYFPEKIILIDLLHTGEHLSNVAARRDPTSFVRAHLRIFKNHQTFFANHPRVAMDRAIVGMKLALRALNPIATARFALYYLQSCWRLITASL